ncbi:golgin subfamily A member 6-like protein 24 [Clytia hemisphaerica]|uniref:SCP domain-containing protein n=1 Tax=Clytia hemisphaerica TaxID=252671 RepID=A0A7M5WZW2_9CNID
MMPPGRLYFITLFLLLNGCFASSAHPTRKNATKILEKMADKKGTIRIAGPWNSDSALDRNVDMGEDAYVKKIISSNEGINFNKDMAEAGEMFEVNGIDDFYDKNAMITYEINGHEIPVHMKPHLTPQTKSLFPEYVKDSPGQMQTGGFVRGSKAGGMLHGYAKKVAGVKLPAGLSLNDMPEYKMQRFTGKTLENSNMWKSLEGLKQDKDNGDLRYAYKQNHAITNLFQKQLPALAAFQKHYNHQSRYTKPAFGDQILKHHVPRHHRLGKPLLREFMNQYPHESTKADETIEHKPALVQEFMSMKPNEEFEKEENEKASGKSERNEYRFAARKTNGEHQEQIRHEDSIENKHFTQEKNAQQEKATSLFQNLDSLHQKLQLDKQINAAELQSKSASQDPHKAEAKTRILNLLGELTEKLKGMESIVTRHRDKEIEAKFIKEQTSTNQENKFEDTEKSRLPEDHSPSQSDSDVDTMNRIEAQLKEKVSNLQEGIQNANSRSYPNEGPEEESKHEKFFMNSFRKIGNSEQVGSEFDSHRIESQAKYHSNQAIEGFRQPDTNQPIIMDTKAIDFNPADGASMENDDSDQVNSVNSDGEEQVVEEPSQRKFVGRDDEDDEDETSDEDPHKGKLSAPVRKHWKKPEVDEDFVPTRQTLMKYHQGRHHNAPSSEEDDTEQQYDVGEEKKLSRRHKPHHKKIEEKDDGDNELLNHSFIDDDEQLTNKRHHKKSRDHEEAESNENDEEEITNSHHHKQTNGDSEEQRTPKEGKENSKMFEVEESLGEADEKNNIARHRSFKPKERDDEVDDYPDYNEVKDAAIFETNFLRKKFHAQSLHWSDRLSDRAQKTAETIANVRDLNPKSILKYKKPGQNVAVIDIDSTNVGKEAPDNWAKESRFFDFRSPQLTPKNSDFAQMMWKAENEFGLGVAKSKLGNKWIVTSAYDSPVVDRYNDLKHNVESDIPISDPYSDITG